jgi:hypothetical protein
MSDNASIVVFPSIFAYNKLNSLIFNIKKILEIKNQPFQSIKRDGSIIIVEANDPVFASSAINLLFGIEKVAIAKKIKNDFEILISGITKIGSNLLLKGERFYVKVDGQAKGYLPKDIEIAATSSLIEKTTKIGAKPGTEDKYDKLLYTYLTKSNAYVCIFIDKGNGGIPNNFQKEKVVCCVYDELSAVSCLEIIREGFDVKIIVCFRKESELLNLVKILNNLIPRTLKSKIGIEFFQISIQGKGAKNYMLMVEAVTEIILSTAILNHIKRVSLAISPLIFPQAFIDKIASRVYQKNIIPHTPLLGLGKDILDCAKEIGLEKYLPQIEQLGKMKFNSVTVGKNAIKIAQQALETKRVVTVTVGPNNVHDILDSLQTNH